MGDTLLKQRINVILLVKSEKCGEGRMSRTEVFV